MSAEVKSSRSSLDEKHDIEAAHPHQDEHLVEEVTDAHFADPNLDRANLGDLEEDSPYPEVRSAVANTDDPDMPCNTIRVWILGMIMAIIIPGLNQFLYVCFSSSSRFGIAFLTRLPPQFLPIPLRHSW